MITYVLDFLLLLKWEVFRTFLVWWSPMCLFITGQKVYALLGSITAHNSLICQRLEQQCRLLPLIKHILCAIKTFLEGRCSEQSCCLTAPSSIFQARAQVAVCVEHYMSSLCPCGFPLGFLVSIQLQKRCCWIRWRLQIAPSGECVCAWGPELDRNLISGIFFPGYTQNLPQSWPWQSKD